jgi:hypothetical protein
MRKLAERLTYTTLKEENEEALSRMSWEIGANSDHEHFFHGNGWRFRNKLNTRCFFVCFISHGVIYLARYKTMVFVLA